MTKLLFQYMAMLFALGMPLSVFAVEVQPNEFLITAHGTVTVPPCHINNDETVDIDFGTVGIRKVINGSPSTSTWIPVLCEDAETPFSVKITGNTLDNQSNVLATSVQGLGISLTQAGKAVPLNEFITPDNQTGIQLTSTLTATPSFSDEERDFYATATISTQYE